MNPPQTEGEPKRKRLEFSISSDGSGETEYSQGYYTEEARDSLTELIPKMNRTPSCISTFTQCANQQKLDDLYKSYTKLKIYFCVLCVVNVIIILLVCIFFAVFFMRFSNDSKGLDNVFSTPQRNENDMKPGKAEARHQVFPLQEKKQETKIRCSILKHKLNASNYDSEDMCSLEEMVDSIAKFLKPREYNDVLHLTEGTPQTDGSDCFLKQWIKDKDSSSPISSGLSFNSERGTIIIPSSGYYYVYSRITFKYNSTLDEEQRQLLQLKDIKHTIEKSRNMSSKYKSVQSTSVQCTKTSFVHSSFLQRVVYLEKGDELRVKMSDTGKLQYDEKYKHENYFGVFKL
ncbi:tumor necrosis factor ligand superfamily member 6-like [Saccostrea echinata]|uniref:tumor necrosis factor ligand superfamily member 6-like n=1 Tax=Saccostrea echinata TaxID=191078 RepID=UPI002A828536|nr:tumor necrosis factor ligand superfamily member 6-like [Saccostrea echinata]